MKARDRYQLADEDAGQIITTSGVFTALSRWGFVIFIGILGIMLALVEFVRLPVVYHYQTFVDNASISNNTMSGYIEVPAGIVSKLDASNQATVRFFDLQQHRQLPRAATMDSTYFIREGMKYYSRIKIENANGLQSLCTQPVTINVVFRNQSILQSIF
jgi:hypothetical protein